MKYIFPAILALFVMGNPTPSHAASGFKDAMKARSTVVTGDRCEDHARELNDNQPDILQNYQCYSIHVSHCRIKIPYQDRGRCHAEYEVRNMLSGAWKLCDRNLRWIIRIIDGVPVLKQRKSRWWVCTDSSGVS